MGASLELKLKSRAHELGFALAGIAPATEADSFARFTAWLDAGHAGEMGYLHRHREARQHPRAVLENVRSVIMVAMEYESGDRRQEAGDKTGPSGRVASYAAGPDYHLHIWERLNQLGEWLEAEVPGSTARGVTDTAPLLERDFARRAGLGWIGKNSMLIHPRHGSFFFLGALLTDVELTPDPPFEASHCGTCAACLQACPTQAFPQPGLLDATKCISYLTIELRSPVAHELREPIGDWLFGCDICQDVCPWNRKWSGQAVSFPHDPGLATLDPIELLGLDDVGFRERFRKTSLWRTRRAGLLRNAAIVLGNTGDERALPALEHALCDREELIREAAEWAIGRIRQRASSGWQI